MVAYGKQLNNARRPGWERAYLEYSDLKHLLERELQEAVLTGIDTQTQQSRFLNKLEQEIEKVSLFTLSRQGELADAVGAYRFPDFKTSSLLLEPQQSQPPAPPPPPPPTVATRALETSQPPSEADLLLSPIKKHSGERVAPLPSFATRSSSENLQAAAAATVRTRPMFRAPESLRVMATTSHHPRSSATAAAAATGDVEAPAARTTTTTTTTTTANCDTAALTTIAIELLHLLRFICINAVGIRKILKKYDKVMALDADANSNSGAGADHDNLFAHITIRRPADHVQQLANAASISAIHASLESALRGLVDAAAASPSAAVANGGEAVPEDVGAVRLQCAIEAIQVLREYAVIVNQPFSEFLSRRAMIVTGRDREERKALLAVLRFDPDTLAATTDAELLNWKRAQKMQQQKQQRHHRKLNSVLNMDDVIMDLEGDFVVDEPDSWGGVDRASMVINLASTLLYTINYYIIAPTANHYAISLGTDGAFGSTLIGASSFAAIFAAFLYSFWYTKSSFRSALLFSSLAPFLGNLLYSVAISYQSMNMALAGRVLCGFGSAEVVNRQLISACVSFSNMTRASALFVAAGAIGMGVGPLVAGILETVFGTDMEVDIKTAVLPRGGIIVNHITSPGLVMSTLWFLEMLAISCFFQEPDRINGGGSSEKDSSKKTTDTSNNGSNGLHINTGHYGSASSLKELVDSDDEEKLWLIESDDGKPHVHPGKAFCDQIFAIYKLIFENAALPVTLYLFAFIELVDEVLISSCSMVVHRYFGWHGSTAGFLIASLGSLVLPADFFVERMSHVYSERKIMKNSLIFLIVCMIGILNMEGLIFDSVGVAEGENATYQGIELKSYLNRKGEFYYDWSCGRYVYIFFLSTIFMGTIVLEGVDTSLMSRVSPPSLNDTFINCGLLATLIGTLGRVAGDSMITISALVDKNIYTDFVNATFLPLIPLALFGLFLVIRYYKQFV